MCTFGQPFVLLCLVFALKGSKKSKKWWVSLPNGKIEVSVYVKRKRLELETGKDAIEIDGKSELVSTLESIQRSVDHGDFDSLI